MAEKIFDFFAAANGYGGFRSYFDTVFNSNDYDKIFVIKGGPGTGKSSFMKKMAQKYLELGCDIEKIHCSSDPNSLDGVILEKENKRIAFLDGTAPHERDAAVVGAIDEIINLGASLDTRFLTAKKNEILALNKEKKKAYATAYYYLEIAGLAAKKKKAIAVSNFNTEKAKNGIKYLAEYSSPAESLSEKTRLISAFGSHGKSRLTTIEKSAKKLYSIVGDYYASSLLLNEIHKLFLSLRNDIYIFASPLDSDCIEAIYLPSQSIGFTLGTEGEKIDSEDYIFPADKADNERVKKAAEIEGCALEESMRWFSIASDLHFRLEDLYIGAMDFDINDKIFEQKVREIDNILESRG